MLVIKNTNLFFHGVPLGEITIPGFRVIAKEKEWLTAEALDSGKKFFLGITKQYFRLTPQVRVKSGKTGAATDQVINIPR
jgi:hypothetical protein